MNEVLDNKKKSEILAEEISKLNYEDIILHSQIAEIIQEDYGSNKYRSEIDRTKKILLKKYNKILKSIKGDGYRVVKPDDFVGESLGHYKRGFNEMQKGQDILTNAPVKDMTDEGRTIFRRVYDRAVILNASMQGAVVELKTLGTKKKHPMAVENVKAN